MSSREAAIARAQADFDSGAFRERMEALIAIPSTSQDPAHAPDCRRYLEEGITPWLARMGFESSIHPNPDPACGPILIASRIEDPSRPTALLYGHGDTVLGLEEQWSPGLKPWTITEKDGLWYGRGTADNKGQHIINLTALEAVLAERGGKLGANVKLVLEMSEELGSKGLRPFIEAHRDYLAADALIASDGPRVEPGLPTIAAGSRGSFMFELVVKLRNGGVHSGHWGGLTRDPAILLSHAIASIADQNGKILVRDWLPGETVPANIRAALEGCPVGGGEGAATIDEGWGEPGLTPAEKIYGWASFIVLAMLSGKPEAPVNAVAPWARAACQIRYTGDSDPARFEAALRAHLDANGFDQVAIERAGIRMPASRTAPDNPWVLWTKASMEKSLGTRVQVTPNASGGLPGDVFVDLLGTPLVWVPHSYNGCKQHGPDEHVIPSLMREGLSAFAGIWWDLGEAGTPPRG
ncbi:M20 family metallopeptidase [Roseomonas sp. SSH11]|uniref:M20 family metallopeptidase n=1 Tax=Pararoseomonas baculiformis TaxID=2820812 RepID=A0ABS4AF06_9PROT|nr:M20 family metallopeptidase [Pararoseomonas baculiformis]MBP0445618.1 M20 family metallopeptidase [Pararoseomonas baculiformis]